MPSAFWILSFNFIIVAKEGKNVWQKTEVETSLIIIFFYFIYSFLFTYFSYDIAIRFIIPSNMLLLRVTRIHNYAK